MQQRQDPDNAHGTTRVVTRAQFLSQSNHAKRRTAAEKIIKKNAAGKSKKAKKTANSGEKVKKNATMVEMKNAQVFVKIPSRVRIAAAVGTVQGVPVRRSRRSRRREEEEREKERAREDEMWRREVVIPAHQGGGGLDPTGRGRKEAERKERERGRRKGYGYAGDYGGNQEPAQVLTNTGEIDFFAHPMPIPFPSTYW